jgi:hypothetical protein
LHLFVLTQCRSSLQNLKKQPPPPDQNYQSNLNYGIDLMGKLIFFLTVTVMSLQIYLSISHPPQKVKEKITFFKDWSVIFFLGRSIANKLLNKCQPSYPKWKSFLVKSRFLTVAAGSAFIRIQLYYIYSFLHTCFLTYFAHDYLNFKHTSIVLTSMFL